MYIKEKLITGTVSQILDIVTICVTYITLMVIYDRFSLPIPTAQLLSLTSITICWHFVSKFSGIYASKRFLTIWDDVQHILVNFALFGVFVKLAKIAGLVTFPTLTVFIIISFLIVVTIHTSARLVLRSIRQNGRNQRRMLIYGNSRTGRKMARQLIEMPWMGVQVVGFLDELPSDTLVHLHDLNTSIPILGCGEDAYQVVTSSNVDEVLICLPNHEHSKVSEMINAISSLHVNVRLVPDVLDLVSIKPQIEMIGDIPIIGLKQPSINGNIATMKRLIDFIGAAILILLAGPIWWIVPILIKLDSKGPVFFIQERIGENGRPFLMYKFRTMVPNAEDLLNEIIDLSKLNEPVFKIKNDPRITRVGHILRKTSLDELPQLFNVLLGDMSLVGPRPEESMVVAMYDYKQRQRLAVKPGITGPMQVNGRGDLDFEKRLALEVDYIKNYSLLRDFALILKTIPAVLLSKGAH